MRYFKITKPESLAAWEQSRRDTEAMTKAARDFAERIAPGRAKGWYTTGPTRRVAGFSFSPPMTGPEWTKPDRQHGMQRPRAKVPTDAKQALADLQAIWNDYPKQSVDMDGVFKTFGFSWGFIYGYSMFAHCGALYFSTSDPHQQIDGTEILGSEFSAAEAEHRARANTNPTPQPA